MAKYRVVTYWNYSGENHRLEKWRWWWPFWTHLTWPADMTRARQYAENDAAKGRHKTKITPIKVRNHG